MTTTRKLLRAYTTRKMSSDLLNRMRVLAAMKSAEDGSRVTLEAILTDVIRKGLPILEKEIL
mgnify:CR=1 FL=1